MSLRDDVVRRAIGGEERLYILLIYRDPGGRGRAERLQTTYKVDN